MKNAIAPTSDSYHDFLISNLKDPNYAAVYLETHLEEQEPEPELLKLALSHVAEALGESSEQAKQRQQELDAVLSDLGSLGIYKLNNWLNALGLRLTVTVCQADMHEMNDPVITAEVGVS